MPRITRPLFALALLLLGTRLPLAAQERVYRPTLTPQVIEPALRTDWYGVYLRDQKIGYARSALTRLDGKQAGYLLSVQLRIDAVSAGEKLRLDVSEETEFDARPPYAFRRGKSSQSSNGAGQVLTLTRTDKGFQVVTATNGDRSARTIGPLDFTLADSLASYVWMLQRPKAGDRVVTRDLNFDELKMEEEERKLLATKTAVVKGVEVTYHEVEAVSAKQGIKTLERYDDQGNLLSGHIGEAFETRMEPEEQAKNLTAGADLFVLGQVKIDRPLGKARRVSGLVVEAVGKDAALLEAGPRQAIGNTAAGATVLKVGRAHGRPVRATAEEVQDNLAETAAYPVTHPKVKALARQAVGDARTDREKAERLVHFVYDFLEPSYRGKGLVVLDLLEKREGDCTAYAALFTTLARAAGLPAREVSGLMYLGDGQKAFGGHAWNEVLVDGFWVPVDASCNETEVNATHLSFGTDARGGANLLRSFGGLSLRLIEVQHRK